MINRFFKHRLWTVLTAGLAVLFLVFLAAGLKNIRFQPGRPLPHAESIPFQVSVGNITEAIASIPIWKQVVLVGLIILLAIIVVALFPPEWRKKILKYFVRYALFVIALFFIVRYFHGLFPPFNLNGAGAPANGAPASDASDLPVFTAPRISSTLLYLISLGVVLILAGIAILISRKWLQKAIL